MSDAIVQVGDPVLRGTAKTVLVHDITSPKLKKIIAKMKATLAKEEFGVAIAAPQIGEPLRIFVVAGRSFQTDKQKDKGLPPPPDKTFINPEIFRLSKKKLEMSEGCLSVRGKYGTVLRHEKASVRARDERGEAFVYHGSGLIAHIFQHECDHLDGTLYIDKALRITDEETKATEFPEHDE